MMSAEKVISQLREDVAREFEVIRNTLVMREKLLFRQIDVIASQSQKNSSLIQDIKFLPESEDEVLNSIRSFGKFNLDNLNFSDDLYVNEDYICPSVDHETMYKCLNGNDNGNDQLDYNDDGQGEVVIVDFSNNKSLIKENVHNLNESIINITLNEAKELIQKTGVSLPQLGDSFTKEQRTQTSQIEGNKTARCHKKPNITINNCNGTINLKNISNLTINCANPNSVKAIKTNSSITGSQDDDTQTPKEFSKSFSISEGKDNENNSVNCEFYNRLITEIKNSLKQNNNSQSQSIADNNSTTSRRSLSEAFPTSSSSDTLSNDSYNRKMLLKNYDNLKIVLENNENDTHPVQIEQWLTEIISDTEIEPIQNNEILEHSQIHSNELF